MNVLRELGLEDKVMASASVIERNLAQTTKGRLIARTELGEVSRMAGAPCICIHRGILQKILLDAVPVNSVRTGVRCAGFDALTAILENGERIEADVLVGADGIFSVIRGKLHGEEAPRYAGYTCWRGIREDNPGFLPERSALARPGRRIPVRGVALRLGEALLVPYKECSARNEARENGGCSRMPQLGGSGSRDRCWYSRGCDYTK
jgi:2-polyprenyl-6-methoxyphenol hydroxylase-like FAD-dependent oxidoreductase